MKDVIKILIADDHHIFRKGVLSILAEDKSLLNKIFEIKKRK